MDLLRRTAAVPALLAVLLLLALASQQLAQEPGPPDLRRQAVLLDPTAVPQASQTTTAPAGEPARTPRRVTRVPVPAPPPDVSSDDADEEGEDVDGD